MAQQFEALNTIRYLRALDMPLPDIEDFLRNRDIDIIEEKLRRQKQAVNRQISGFTQLHELTGN